MAEDGELRLVRILELVDQRRAIAFTDSLRERTGRPLDHQHARQYAQQVIEADQMAALLLAIERAIDGTDEVCHQRLRDVSRFERQRGVCRATERHHEPIDQCAKLHTAAHDEPRGGRAGEQPAARPVHRGANQGLGLVLHERRPERHPCLQRAFGQHALAEAVDRGDGQVIQRRQCTCNDHGTCVAMLRAQQEQVVVAGTARGRRAAPDRVGLSQHGADARHQFLRRLVGERDDENLRQ